jgi:hypothetical protein
MTDLTNFTTIITNGMNDPNCSFYVGLMSGQLMTVRYIFYLALIYFVFKFIDKIAFDPLIAWIKKKFKFLRENKKK